MSIVRVAKTNEFESLTDKIRFNVKSKLCIIGTGGYIIYHKLIVKVIMKSVLRSPSVLRSARTMFWWLVKPIL